MRKTIRFVDMFAGIGGFREGLRRAGGFICVGHSELDKNAGRSYRALFDTRGEWSCDDIRKADAGSMPDFELLCEMCIRDSYTEKEHTKPSPLKAGENRSYA